MCVIKEGIARNLNGESNQQQQGESIEDLLVFYILIYHNAKVKKIFI